MKITSKAVSNNKHNKRYRFLIKITLIVFISFFIATMVMWAFFRSTARNIGYYLATGRKNTAVVLITEYLGNPPSRLKAKILSNFYNLNFEYYDNGVLKWSVGSELDQGRKKRDMFYGRNSGGGPMMKNEPFEHMRRMMRGMFKRDVFLDDGKILSIYFPIYTHRKIFLFPLIFIFVAILSIAALIFFIIKKTLLPIQKLIDASHRIGNGDLSYRLSYEKNDDFSNVVKSFNTMAEKLENMLISQRELLHMISHELRTPLTRINLALEMGDIERCKEIIRDETKEMNELIESIMELSRLEIEEIAVEKSDLIEILKKIIEKYNKLNFKLDIKVPSAKINGKKILVEKAISNVIDNAFKYSDGREPVYIKLFSDNDDQFICSVRNSGRGLDKDEIKDIFKPFYRGKNATLQSNRPKEGKGLGLVVANRIVEGLGGYIRCKSSPEGPTEFIIVIPSYKS